MEESSLIADLYYYEISDKKKRGHGCIMLFRVSKAKQFIEIIILFFLAFPLVVPQTR